MVMGPQIYRPTLLIKYETHRAHDRFCWDVPKLLRGNSWNVLQSGRLQGTTMQASAVNMSWAHWPVYTRHQKCMGMCGQAHNEPMDRMSDSCLLPVSDLSLAAPHTLARHDRCRLGLDDLALVIRLVKQNDKQEITTKRNPYSSQADDQNLLVLANPGCDTLEYLEQ